MLICVMLTKPQQGVYCFTWVWSMGKPLDLHADDLFFAVFINRILCLLDYLLRCQKSVHIRIYSAILLGQMNLLGQLSRVSSEKMLRRVGGT